MKSSESIKNLAVALVKVQSVLESAKKDSDNPFFKSRYADLSSVWDACRKPLTDNGLAVVQTCTPVENNGIQVDTILLHVSGEYIESNLFMPLVKNDPQATGSAITYARRYALSAIVGIVADDDDAESAMSRPQAPAYRPNVPVNTPASMPINIIKQHVDSISDIPTANAVLKIIYSKTEQGSETRKQAISALFNKAKELGLDYSREAKSFVGASNG